MFSRILLINNLYSESENLRIACRQNGLPFDEYRHTELDQVCNHNTYSGVILSGTGDSPDEKLDVYADEIALVKKLRCPLLGICGGAQIIALASGGKVTCTLPVGGRRQVQIGIDDPLFVDLPNSFVVFSKHRRAISTVPQDFQVLASEQEYGFPYVIKHKSKPTYAVQFHPERRNDGTQLMANFFALCKPKSHVLTAADANKISVSTLSNTL